MRNLLRAVPAALALVLCAGCALTSKSDSVILRYFTPELALARATVPPEVDANATLELRLGRVNAASYIKDRIAYRASEYEVGFYEELRWTEKPESYVRRALVRSLFEEHRVRQMISGLGLVLEVDLNAFEEVRTPRHAAHVEMTWMLHGPSAVVVQRTLIVEHPLASTSSDALAAAMAAALHEAIQTMTNDVVAEVSKSAVKTNAP